MGNTFLIRAHSNSRDIVRQGRRFARREVPFAIARALTDVAFITRKRIVRKVWPSSVEVRSKSFANASFRVEKANKRNLKAVLFDRLKTNAMAQQASGGTRHARGGRKAIPLPYAENRLTSTGKTPKRLQPSNNEKIFRVNDVLYFRVRKRVIPLFILRSSVRQPQTFDFFEESLATAIRWFPIRFAQRIKRFI